MSSQDLHPQPLRVALMGTRGIPARYGGFETFAEQISQRLAQKGYHLTVYGRCRFWQRWGQQEPVYGVQRRVTPTIFHKYLETPLHALTSFIDALFCSYDVILVCNAANSPLAPILKMKGVPLVINVDGIERNRAKWNAFGKLWYLLGERCSVWLADRIVSDADVIAEYYKGAYGCDSTVIPYGVHPTVRPPGPTLAQFGLEARNYILYVSRLEPENNALGVIEAYKRSNADIPLVIVGDAPYAQEYKALLRAAANDRVIFTGFQFGEAYQELQSNCRLYIQATEVGGTHPALIESMSYGNCVIANGTPENREVVADAGIVFSKNDFQELGQHISRVWNDADLMRELGDKAKKRVTASYSWEAVVAKYEGLFQRLVAERARPIAGCASANIAEK
jgi:glycosyltransferase involved in cell wall biosynthesis